MKTQIKKLKKPPTITLTSRQWLVLETKFLALTSFVAAAERLGFAEQIAQQLTRHEQELVKECLASAKTLAEERAADLGKQKNQISQPISPQHWKSEAQELLNNFYVLYHPADLPKGMDFALLLFSEYGWVQTSSMTEGQLVKGLKMACSRLEEEAAQSAAQLN
jgi:hypothetical protein